MSFKKLICGLTASAMLMMCGCGDIYGSEAETDEETETISEEEAPAETEAPTEEESSTDVVPPIEVTTTTVPVTITTETEEETTEEVTEEETTVAATAPKLVKGAAGISLVPGVELRMTLDEVREALGDKADELEELYDGYDCTTYAFPVDGVFGVDMEGYCFFDINFKSGKLQTYGYHLGDSGDMAAPDYPYSEAELRAGYDIIIGQLIDAYGGKTDDDCEYEGIKQWYLETTPDGDEIWAVYGVDMWAEGSGVNEIAFSMSIPYEERGE